MQAAVDAIILHMPVREHWNQYEHWDSGILMTGFHSSFTALDCQGN